MHHVAVFAGVASETRPRHATDYGFASAPEVNLDLIGDEKTTWVYGLAFGREF